MVTKNFFSSQNQSLLKFIPAVLTQATSVLRITSGMASPRQGPGQLSPRAFIALMSLVTSLTLGCQTFPGIETRRDGPSAKTEKKGSPTTGSARSETLPNDDYEDTRDNGPIVDEQTSSESPAPTETPAARPIPQTPKIGVIIGPGFLRSYLAAGVLQEFHKARVPIHAMVGFEWGSLPAALYAINGQANEVEWQMMKLNEQSVLKKSLIRNQIESQSVAELQGFLNQAFGAASFEQNRVPFECLTFDYKKKQYFWMKKGGVAKALPYCLASPPFSKPFLNNVGAVDLKLAADTLRQKGANYIVLVNPLSTNKEYLDSSYSSESQVLWAYQQYQLMKTTGIVDYVVDTSSAGFSVVDFAARREMIRKGQEIGQQAVKKLGAKLGI